MRRPISAVVLAVERLAPPGLNGNRIQDLVRLLRYGQDEGAFSRGELADLSYAVASLRSMPDLLDDSAIFLAGYEHTEEAKSFLDRLRRLQEELGRSLSE